MTGFKVGDRGQRYEVSCLNEAEKKQIVGWSEDFQSALSMAQGVKLHPTFHNPKITQRRNANRNS